jgi:hypothetical protein
VSLLSNGSEGVRPARVERSSAAHQALYKSNLHLSGDIIALAHHGQGAAMVTVSSMR